MMRETVSKWANHLPELTAVDALGVNFRRSPKGNNYFEGNFWISRSDWIAHLDDPWTHRANPGSWLGGKRWDRMHAEIWILHKPYHHVESLLCRDADLWRLEFCESLLNHPTEPIVLPPPSSTPMSDDEIRRLIRHPGATDAMPESLRQEVQSILKDCGCRFRSRLDPLMEQIRPFFSIPPAAPVSA